MPNRLQNKFGKRVLTETTPGTTTPTNAAQWAAAVEEHAGLEPHEPYLSNCPLCLAPPDINCGCYTDLHFGD